MTDYQNRVNQISESEGEGDFVVDVDLVQYQTIHHAHGTHVEFEYCIQHKDQTIDEWEVGIGHLADQTTLVRTRVLSSSNGHDKVDFSAGPKFVLGVVSAETIKGLQTQIATLSQAKPSEEISKHHPRAYDLHAIYDPYGLGATTALASIEHQTVFSGAGVGPEYATKRGQFAASLNGDYAFGSAEKAAKYFTSPHGIRPTMSPIDSNFDSYSGDIYANKYGDQTLATALAEDDTTVILSTARAQLRVGDLFDIDEEILEITAADDHTTFQVLRGAHETVAKPHAAGTAIKAITYNGAREYETIMTGQSFAIFRWYGGVSMQNILIDGKHIPASMIGTSKSVSYLVLNFKRWGSYRVSFIGGNISEIRGKDRSHTLNKPKPTTEAGFGDSFFARIYQGLNTISGDFIQTLSEPARTSVQNITAGYSYAIMSVGDTDWQAIGADENVSAAAMQLGQTYTIVDGGDTDWAAAGATTINADKIIAGLQVTIKNVGTTDFTTIGASNNHVGTTFTATGNVAGNGTAYCAIFTHTNPVAGSGTAIKTFIKTTAVGTGTGQVGDIGNLTKSRDNAMRKMAQTYGKPLPYVSALGGTGYASIHGAAVNYKDRIRYCKRNEHIKTVWLFGTGNDSTAPASAADIVPNGTYIIENIKRPFPNCTAIILSGCYPGFASDSDTEALNVEIQKLKTAHPDITVLIENHPYYGAGRAIWTGHGEYGAPTGLGSTDLYLGSSGILDAHCNIKGIERMAEFYLEALSLGDYQ